jgi:hypothetical protein
LPITVATRSDAWTVFAHSKTGIVVSNSNRGMDVCVLLFCVCVVLCVDSVLATGWSPVHGVLPKVYTEGSKKMYSHFEFSHHTGHTDSRIHSAVRRHRRCLAADGGHFEHIQWLSLSPRKNCEYMSFCSKVLTIKELVYFFGPLCILRN